MAGLPDRAVHELPVVRACSYFEGIVSSSMRSLNILMAAVLYSPYIGGVETHTREVAKRQAAMGHRVTVLTCDPTGELPREDELDGVHILRVPVRLKRMDLYVAPEMVSYILQGQWDIVHQQGYHTLVPPVAMAAALRARLPYVVTFHSGGHSSKVRNAIRGTQQWMLRPLLARADRLIGVSRFEAQHFQQHLHLPPEQFQVVPNGSNLPDVRFDDKPVDGLVHLVSVGRLERYKGHQRAIEAMPHVLARCPGARLRIVGKGPYEPELRSLVGGLGLNEYVTIGVVPAEDRAAMVRVLAEATLVLLLSDYEAHPISVMEALSVGRPVLVTYTSGLAELADQGLVRSVPLDSPPSHLAHAVLENIAQPHIPSEVRLRTWDDCAADLLSLYRHVLEAPRFAS